MNEVICGKAEEVLKWIPSNSIDFSLQSPPYDSCRSYSGTEWNFEVFKLIAKELTRVLKPGGIIAWVVGDTTDKNGSETLTSFKQALYFKEECNLLMHDTMIYEKAGLSYPSKNRYYQSFEYIFILSKGKPKTFNPIKDLPNKNAGKPAHWGKINYRKKNGELIEEKKAKNYITPEFGVRRNIWKYPTGKGNTTKDKISYKHPALMSELLARDLILSFSNPGDLTLDCFAGACTTLKMAKLTGRNYIGIEISKEYCEIARQRLNFLL